MNILIIVAVVVIFLLTIIFSTRMQTAVFQALQIAGVFARNWASDWSIRLSEICFNNSPDKESCQSYSDSVARYLGARLIIFGE